MAVEETPIGGASSTALVRALFANLKAWQLVMERKEEREEEEEEDDDDLETCTDGDESDPGARVLAVRASMRLNVLFSLLFNHGMLTRDLRAEWQAPPQVEQRRSSRSTSRYGSKGRAPPRANGNGSAVERLGAR
jgi:hypothetical protein